MRRGCTTVRVKRGVIGGFGAAWLQDHGLPAGSETLDGSPRVRGAALGLPVAARRARGGRPRPHQDGHFDHAAAPIGWNVPLCPLPASMRPAFCCCRPEIHEQCFIPVMRRQLRAQKAVCLPSERAVCTHSCAHTGDKGWGDRAACIRCVWAALGGERVLGR